MQTEHIDIVIIGAGISGIGAAYYLQKNCPNKSLAILEGRESIGGTWDLFRYPGIRSDSDMYTYGYQFKPWIDRDSLASGDRIKEYLNETIQENDLTNKIRLSHRVKKLNWSSGDSLWQISLDVNGEQKELTSNFVLCCNGYYDYEQGYQPNFPNQENFKGQFVHPQHWPENLDYANKKIVVIGSGATAVTLIPNLAKTASHVTMLQRSPTYIVSIPMQDWLLKLLYALLPIKLASRIIRYRNILRGKFYYEFMTRFPERAKKSIAKKLDQVLSKGIDRKHFTPKYAPWDQRLCLVPDADLFDALNDGTASMKTDTINQFSKTGIQLDSGEHIQADLIVSATGLNVQIMSGIELTLDGDKVPFGDKMFYRGVLLEDIPNLGFVFGYTNASWTLKVELVSQYISRVINFMDETEQNTCVPVDNKKVERELFLNLSSGYIQRSQNQIPKQGTTQPWRLDQNYSKDKKRLTLTDVDDGVLRFSSGMKK